MCSSGWTEQQLIKVGSKEVGSHLFVTFGVPVEISTDGGPEFIAGETLDFFKRWGIQHRLSSVSLPSSNGRAELAVKSTKRLLMDIVSPNGDLDNDKIMSAFAICSSYLEKTQESTRNGDKLWNQKKKHSKPDMLKPLRTLESIHDSWHHYELVTMCSFRIK